MAALGGDGACHEIHVLSAAETKFTADRVKNTLCKKGEDGTMELWTEPTGEIPREMREALEED